MSTVISSICWGTVVFAVGVMFKLPNWLTALLAIGLGYGFAHLLAG